MPRARVAPAFGAELGLLLCIPKRLWGENTDRPKRFAVFPTAASIRGAEPLRYTVPDYPYEISVG